MSDYTIAPFSLPVAVEMGDVRSILSRAPTNPAEAFEQWDLLMRLTYLKGDEGGPFPMFYDYATQRAKITFKARDLGEVYIKLLTLHGLGTGLAMVSAHHWWLQTQITPELEYSNYRSQSVLWEDLPDFGLLAWSARSPSLMEYDYCNPVIVGLFNSILSALDHTRPDLYLDPYNTLSFASVGNMLTHTEPDHMRIRPHWPDLPSYQQDATRVAEVSKKAGPSGDHVALIQHLKATLGGYLARLTQTRPENVFPQPDPRLDDSPESWVPHESQRQADIHAPVEKLSMVSQWFERRFANALASGTPPRTFLHDLYPLIGPEVERVVKLELTPEWDDGSDLVLDFEEYL